MKVRIDFITNSSSSSFLLAFKSQDLTQRQKDAIVKYVLEHALGEPATDETLHAWYGDADCGYGFNEDERTDSDGKKEICDKDTDLCYAKSLQKDGWTVRIGSVTFDPAVFEHADFLRGLWCALTQADPGNTELIDADLSY